MIHPIPDDANPSVTSDYTLHGEEPDLYPIFSMADTVEKRNEFVYQFPDYPCKIIIGPVNRAEGWTWRLEIHPDSIDAKTPRLFPTFSAAFDAAEEITADTLSETQEADEQETDAAKPLD